MVGMWYYIGGMYVENTSNFEVNRHVPYCSTSCRIIPPCMQEYTMQYLEKIPNVRRNIPDI